jgi:hypothetical protein
MKLVESKTLGTAAAFIEFTSIPDTFTDLVAFVSSRSTRTAFPQDNLLLRINGDTGSNYSVRLLYGNGSSAASFSDTKSELELYQTSSDGGTSNTFGNHSVYFPNYTSAVAKSISIDGVNERNATEAYQQIIAGLWSGTATISSIRFYVANGNLVAGSTISLYGILKGTDGIVTTS